MKLDGKILSKNIHRTKVDIDHLLKTWNFSNKNQENLYPLQISHIILSKKTATDILITKNTIFYSCYVQTYLQMCTEIDRILRELVQPSIAKKTWTIM